MAKSEFPVEVPKTPKVKATKEALFKKRVNERELEIMDVGTVRVRALSRAEVLGLTQNGGEIDAAGMERKLISLGMVDPQMTEEEVGQWQEASPANELNEVAETIMTLSGVNVKETTKEAMQTFHTV